MNRKAFTLVEMLVVISIILVLSGLLGAGFSKARVMAKRAKAKNDISQLGDALRAYYAEYDTWPTYANNTVPPNRLTLNELQALYQILGGVDRALDTTVTGVGNPKQIVFLQPSLAEMKTVIDTGGNLYSVGASAVTNWVDPWDRSYMVMLDSTGSGKTVAYGITVGSPPIVPCGFAIWSAGPDMKVNDAETSLTDSQTENKDNLTSWK